MPEATHASADSVKQSARDDAQRRRRDLDAKIAARAGILDALVLDDAKLLGDHVELLARFDADLDERMAVVGAEAFGFGEFVPNDFARQIGIERFAMTALLARVRGDRRFGSIFLRGCRVRAEHFGFVEQTRLIRSARFALRAEQFAPVSAQSFLGEIALRCHEPQCAA